MNLRKRLEAGEILSDSLLDHMVQTRSAGWGQNLVHQWVQDHDFSEEEIQVLLRGLGHSKKSMRTCVCRILAAMGEDAREIVKTFLAGEPEERARQAAERALKWLG